MAEEDFIERASPLDRVRATANKLENEILELHNVVCFDYQSPSARERALRLESGMSQLAAALRQFRAQIEGE